MSLKASQSDAQSSQHNACIFLAALSEGGVIIPCGRPFFGLEKALFHFSYGLLKHHRWGLYACQAGSTGQRSMHWLGGPQAAIISHVLPRYL